MCGKKRRECAPEANNATPDKALCTPPHDAHLLCVTKTGLIPCDRRAYRNRLLLISSVINKRSPYNVFSRESIKFRAEESRILLRSGGRYNNRSVRDIGLFMRVGVFLRMHFSIFFRSWAFVRDALFTQCVFYPALNKAGCASLDGALSTCGVRTAAEAATAIKWHVGGRSRCA